MSANMEGTLLAMINGLKYTMNTSKIIIQDAINNTPQL